MLCLAAWKVLRRSKTLTVPSVHVDVLVGVAVGLHQHRLGERRRQRRHRAHAAAPCRSAAAGRTAVPVAKLPCNGRTVQYTRSCLDNIGTPAVLHTHTLTSDTVHYSVPDNWANRSAHRPTRTSAWHRYCIATMTPTPMTTPRSLRVRIHCCSTAIDGRREPHARYVCCAAAM